ncbi:MAG: hypothetical protein ACLFUL_09130 [Desulfobacteraceae bacterium]
MEGDIDVPYLTERESFREVLLKDRLRKALMKINLDDLDKPWLDDDRISQIVSALERISEPKQETVGQRQARLHCREKHVACGIRRAGGAGHVSGSLHAGA